MDVRTEKEGAFTELFDTYGELLTEKQREICSLYLEYDLSLGEIGEEKGISRQGVSDCLRTACEQMKEYEDKLSLIALKEEFAAFRRKVSDVLNAAGVADEVKEALFAGDRGERGERGGQNG